jgi:hypothetical protein
MRTIHRRTGRDASSEAESLTRDALLDRAAWAIRQIERAAADELSYASSGLAFFPSKNKISGGSGIIVRRWMAHGVYSRPLAELLAPSGNPDDGVKRSADRLTGAAVRGLLSIFVNDDAEAADPYPVAFAAFERDPKSDGKVWLLARLLVTQFELEQWNDPLIEAQTRLVS